MVIVFFRSQLVLENSMKKGDVLSVAQLAGIVGAKKTSDLIPLCHPLPLTKVDVSLVPDPSGVPCVHIRCLAKTYGKKFYFPV